MKKSKRIKPAIAVLKNNKYVADGLRKAGFEGGWLDNSR